MKNEESPAKILLTAAPEDAEAIKTKAGDGRSLLMHLPLEKYVSAADEVPEEVLRRRIDSTENIIYGHKRNTGFFIRMVRRYDLLEKVKNRVNITSDPLSVTYLEESGVPAVYPGIDKPIKLVELMLRLRRTGPVLYPCGSHQQEEIPALLKELDIEVSEQVLYHLEGPTEAELNSCREKIRKNRIGAVIFHSRGSVNRIPAAFPGLNLEEMHVIAGSRGVADKLKKTGIGTDLVADGNWDSIWEKVQEL